MVRYIYSASSAPFSVSKEKWLINIRPNFGTLLSVLVVIKPGDLSLTYLFIHFHSNMIYTPVFMHSCPMFKNTESVYIVICITINITPLHVARDIVMLPQWFSKCVFQGNKNIVIGIRDNITLLKVQEETCFKTIISMRDILNVLRFVFGHCQSTM